MRWKQIVYWIATAVVAGEQLAGGLTDLIHGGTSVVSGPSVVLLMQRLGYPVYLLTIMGCWSLCGGVTLLVPRFPRLKEWAYAGIFFLYTAAVFSKMAVPGALHGIEDPGALHLDPPHPRRAHARFLGTTTARPDPGRPLPHAGATNDWGDERSHRADSLPIDPV